MDMNSFYNIILVINMFIIIIYSSDIVLVIKKKLEMYVQKVQNKIRRKIILSDIVCLLTKLGFVRFYRLLLLI